MKHSSTLKRYYCIHLNQGCINHDGDDVLLLYLLHKELMHFIPVLERNKELTHFILVLERNNE